DDMRRAWQRVFATIDTPSRHPAGVSADELDLSGLRPDTPIAELGLAPRLAGAVDRLGVADVGSLARVPLNTLALSGVGATVRAELRLCVRRLRDAGLGDEPETLGEIDPTDLQRLSVDRIAERLVPRSNLPAAQRSVLEVLLGLHSDTGQVWPTPRRTAEVTGSDTSEVVAELERARRRWAEHRPELV